MDNRAHRRISVGREIKCTISGVSHWVQLYDLSRGGCQIEVGTGNIRIGDRVSLDLLQVVCLYGEVAWKIDTFAGICFEGLIGDSLIELLGFSASNRSFDEIQPRDSSGRLLGRGEVASPYLPASSDQKPQIWHETASPQVDRRTLERGSDSRRSEIRLDLAARAKVCVSMHSSVEGELTDISANGCCFKVHEQAFEPGTEVWLRLDTLQPWRGIVRWVRGDMVGIKFERPFYPAIVEHIVKLNKPIICERTA